MINDYGIRLALCVHMRDDHRLDRQALYLRAIGLHIQTVVNRALVAVVLEFVERDRVFDHGEDIGSSFDRTLQDGGFERRVFSEVRQPELADRQQVPSWGLCR
jgi:hypothetical protein